MDIDWHIGDVITKLRKRARMNQTVLADKVGVNKATIVRAEDGDVKVSRETYLKIAHVLKTDMATLEGEAARLQADQPPDAIRQPGVSEPSRMSVRPTGSAPKQYGPPLADPTTSAHLAPLPKATSPGDRAIVAAGVGFARSVERTHGVAGGGGAGGQRPATPRVEKAPRLSRTRSHRR